VFNITYYNSASYIKTANTSAVDKLYQNGVYAINPWKTCGNVVAIIVIQLTNI